MSQRTYNIFWTSTAREMLAAIPDRRIRKTIFERVRHLSIDPEKQGKPLIGELSSHRSIRAAGQRYRIIFRIEDEKVYILIVALGIRKKGSKKDVYSLAKRLVQLGLTQVPEEDDPLFEIVGAAECGAEDASEEHDRYLYDSPTDRSPSKKD